MKSIAQPLVSIVMPVYESAKYVDETIQTISKQTYINFECLFIYDPSNDDTLSILEKWTQKDLRFKIINNQNEKSIVGALNSGLQIAKGKYIARADSDDLYESNRLEKQVNFLEEHDDIAIIGTGYAPFNLEGRVLKINHPSNSLVLAWKFIFNTYFCHPSVMFRKSILNQVGYYSKEYQAEDYEYFSRIILSNKGANLEDILVHYRQHDQNRSNSNISKLHESVIKTSHNYFKQFSNNESLLKILTDFDINNTLYFKDFFKIIFFIIHFISVISTKYKYSILHKDYLLFSKYIFAKLCFAIYSTKYNQLKHSAKKAIRTVLKDRRT